MPLVEGPGESSAFALAMYWRKKTNHWQAIARPSVRCHLQRDVFSNVESASRAEAISRYINIMGAGMGLSGFLALLAICIAGLWILGDQRQQKRERREREKWEQSKRDQKLLQELERKLERPD